MGIRITHQGMLWSFVSQQLRRRRAESGRAQHEHLCKEYTYACRVPHFSATTLSDTRLCLEAAQGGIPVREALPFQSQSYGP